jgi:uncharacterized damage-inducible protein DinB
MLDEEYLEDTRLQLRKYKELAEKALAQIGDADLFAAPGPETNSIAIVIKHMAGNMRSRWTDFLTTDGEKPDRHRDREFELEEGDDAPRIRELWQEGWQRTFAALEPLTGEDLGRVVTIRGEPHTVLQAIQRQLTHYAYHVGQIVLLARHLAGEERWQSLSIPKGQSEQYEVSRRGETYRA